MPSPILTITIKAYEEPRFSWSKLSEHAQQYHIEVTRRVLMEAKAVAEELGEDGAAVFLQAILELE